MYGLAAVKVDQKLLGYIEENSFKLNGSKGEVTKINAAQVHGGPVLVIPKSNGTIAPTFDMIQMSFENMQTLMGGELKKDGTQNIIGWKAPSKLIQITKPVTIQTDSEHEISIKKALISAYIDGDLNLDSVSKVKVEVTVMTPDDNSEPFEIAEVTSSVPSSAGGGDTQAEGPEATE